VDDLVLQKCEGRTSYILRAIYNRDKMYCCIADGAMTAILVAHEAIEHLSRATLRRYGSMRLLLRLIVSGKVEVLTEPMPFQDMAEEVLESPSNRLLNIRETTSEQPPRRLSLTVRGRIWSVKQCTVSVFSFVLGSVLYAKQVVSAHATAFILLLDCKHTGNRYLLRTISIHTQFSTFLRGQEIQILTIIQTCQMFGRRKTWTKRGVITFENEQIRPKMSILFKSRNRAQKSNVSSINCQGLEEKRREP
jgi:hypothetical protein